MRPYHITPSAEQDVIDITSYTLEKWGEKQALHYAGLLEKRFHEIGRMTATVRSFSKLYPEIMVGRVNITTSFLRTRTARSRKFSLCYMNVWTL
ncbi:MAG: type II toxin-antitoxin system RelE/ParE family toxin [Methylococcaceae bacterium]